MTNLEKMSQLVGSSADKETVVQWAYMNRVPLIDLPFEDEFVEMKASVDEFFKTHDPIQDQMGEKKNWEEFLDADYVEVSHE